MQRITPRPLLASPQQLFLWRCILPPSCPAVEELRSYDLNFSRSVDAEADSAASNFGDRDGDLVTNHDLFAFFPGKNEHNAPPFFRFELLDR